MQDGASLHRYNKRGGRRWGIAGALLAAALGIGVLGAVLWAMGTTAPLLEAWLDWEAAPMLSAADREPIARLIADTMAGRSSVFQYRGLFSEQAGIHMVDCAPLFRLARTVGLAGFGLFFVSAGLCFFLRRPRETGTGMLTGAGAVLAAVLAIAVWGLADFAGLFTAFHRLMFTNDLWLFPRGDLLITLMPETFFVRCAAVAGGLWLAVLLCTAGAGLLLRRRASAGTAAEADGA